MDVLGELGMGFILGCALLAAFLAYRVARELLQAWFREIRRSRASQRERD